MRTLSQAAEEKLLSAIEKAATYVNDGMTPNDAIIKSASESNIPSGHINLMVHAYNTGRTTKQREQGENTLEKAADFALADVNVVTEALFPKQVKMSHEITREKVISTEYAVSPKGMLARRLAQQQKSAAAQHSWPESTYVRPPRDDKEEARRQYSQKVAKHREYEELRRVASAEYQKAAAAMEALHMYFRHPGNMSFNDAVAETELRIGQDGVTVLKKVAAVYPHLEKQAATNLAHFGPCEPCDLVQNVLTAVARYNEAQKQADVKKKPVAPAFGKKKAAEFITKSILYRPEDEPLTLKEAAIPGLDTVTLRDGTQQKVLVDPAYFPSFAEQQLGHIDGFRPFGGTTAPRTDTIRLSDGSEQKVVYDPRYQPSNRERALGYTAGYRPVGASFKKEMPEPKPMPQPGGGDGPPPPSSKLPAPISDPIGSVANIISQPRSAVGGLRGLATSMAKSMTTPMSAEEEKARTVGAYKQLTDPDHEMRLRNVRAKSVLNDLIVNDEHISSYDPVEITTAFNEISEVAPSLAESPALMRIALRKRLEQGHLADFDIDQLIRMESNKAQIQNTQLASKKYQRDLLE